LSPMPPIITQFLTLAVNKKPDYLTLTWHNFRSHSNIIMPIDLQNVSNLALGVHNYQ